MYIYKYINVCKLDLTVRVKYVIGMVLTIYLCIQFVAYCMVIAKHLR